MNLAALSVHHHSHSKPFLLVEPADLTDNLPMPLMGAVAHVNPRDVHPANSKRLDLLWGAGGRPDGAHQLRPPSAPEPVFLELRLSDCVYVDGRRRGTAKEDDAKIGGGGNSRADGESVQGKRAWKEAAEGGDGRNGAGVLGGDTNRGRGREEAERLSHLFVFSSEAEADCARLGFYS